jgi:hypothetical protein
MKVSSRDVLFLAASMALGAFAFIKTQHVSSAYMEPIVQACTTQSAKELTKEYHDYEPRAGLYFMQTFVCIITQFLYELRRNAPGGLLTWGATIIASLPCSVALSVEAGRAGAVGLIQWPIVIGLLGQVLGISVIIPFVWM